MLRVLGKSVALFKKIAHPSGASETAIILTAPRGLQQLNQAACGRRSQQP